MLSVRLMFSAIAGRDEPACCSSAIRQLGPAGRDCRILTACAAASRGGDAIYLLEHIGRAAGFLQYPMPVLVLLLAQKHYMLMTCCGAQARCPLSISRSKYRPQQNRWRS